MQQIQRLQSVYSNRRGEIFRSIRLGWISDFRFIRLQCIEYEWLRIYQPIWNLQIVRIWHGSEFYYLVSLRWACIFGVLANCIWSYFKCNIWLPWAKICWSSCYYKCKKEWTSRYICRFSYKIFKACCFRSKTRHKSSRFVTTIKAWRAKTIKSKKQEICSWKIRLELLQISQKLYDF